MSDGITKYNTARYIFDFVFVAVSFRGKIILLLLLLLLVTTTKSTLDVVPLGDDVSFVEGAVLEGPAEPEQPCWRDRRNL